MDLQALKNRFSIIGNTPALNHALNTAEQVAATDLTVLIVGESGVGKEVFSQIIHSLSGRKHNPFIAVNCGAIPEGTIDSELFGHEKGSFTGAVDSRKGYFETVNGGTIFLDEIGDMSLAAQSKVLRALQEGKIARVGGDKEIAVNVRVLAATNKDLLSELETKNFRLDLYHRLSIVLIHIPSLNNRRDDIPLLTDFFLQQIAEEYGQEKKSIDKNALEALKQHNWTGNIRELRNVIERLIIFSENTINSEDIKDYVIHN